MAIVNSLISLFTRKRLAQIEYFKENPIEVQENMLHELLSVAANTEYGKEFHFSSLYTPEQFRKRLPIVNYEQLSDKIQRHLHGEENVLWPEEIKWFAKSSGTTDAKSKFLPVTPSVLQKSHFQGGRDVIALFNRNYPNSRTFYGKTLALGGSCEVSKNNNDIRFGDLSAIMISNTPSWTNMMKVPSASVMLMNEWEAKLERIFETTVNKDVRAFAGVPSWFIMLINRVLEKTGKSNLLEVWPNLELFIHGGVSFVPYRERYKELIPSDKMKYMETYNASEGFFGIQDDPNDSSMLLMLDYGIYYEFMPISELGSAHPETILLKDVELGVNYAMIITTCGGLWRYMIGDTITFTSKTPYKFRITGRTKLFINAFGEELIIDNATEALRRVCEETNSSIYEYTAAPVFMASGQKGAHEWLIEFITPPDDIEMFANRLDNELQRLNSDYEAKRYKGLSLERLKIRVAPKGLFDEWMKSRGKLGGQNKVPKLWNDRTHIDQLIQMIENYQTV